MTFSKRLLLVLALFHGKYFYQGQLYSNVQLNLANVTLVSNVFSTLSFIKFITHLRKIGEGNVPPILLQFVSLAVVVARKRSWFSYSQLQLYIGYGKEAIFCPLQDVS